MVKNIKKIAASVALIGATGLTGGGHMLGYGPIQPQFNPDGSLQAPAGTIGYHVPSAMTWKYRQDMSKALADKQYNNQDYKIYYPSSLLGLPNDIQDRWNKNIQWAQAKANALGEKVEANPVIADIDHRRYVEPAINTNLNRGIYSPVFQDIDIPLTTPGLAPYAYISFYQEDRQLTVPFSKVGSVTYKDLLDAGLLDKTRYAMNKNGLGETRMYLSFPEGNESDSRFVSVPNTNNSQYFAIPSSNTISNLDVLYNEYNTDVTKRIIANIMNDTITQLSLAFSFLGTALIGTGSSYWRKRKEKKRLLAEQTERKKLFIKAVTDNSVIATFKRKREILETINNKESITATEYDQYISALEDLVTLSDTIEKYINIYNDDFNSSEQSEYSAQHIILLQQKEAIQEVNTIVLKLSTTLKDKIYDEEPAKKTSSEAPEIGPGHIAEESHGMIARLLSTSTIGKNLVGIWSNDSNNSWWKKTKQSFQVMRKAKIPEKKESKETPKEEDKKPPQTTDFIDEFTKIQEGPDDNKEEQLAQLLVKMNTALKINPIIGTNKKFNKLQEEVINEHKKPKKSESEEASIPKTEKVTAKKEEPSDTKDINTLPTNEKINQLWHENENLWEKYDEYAEQARNIFRNSGTKEEREAVQQGIGKLLEKAEDQFQRIKKQRFSKKDGDFVTQKENLKTDLDDFVRHGFEVMTSVDTRFNLSDKKRVFSSLAYDAMENDVDGYNHYALLHFLRDEYKKSPSTERSTQYQKAYISMKKSDCTCRDNIIREFEPLYKRLTEQGDITHHKTQHTSERKDTVQKNISTRQHTSPRKSISTRGDDPLKDELENRFVNDLFALNRRIEKLEKNLEQSTNNRLKQALQKVINKKKQERSIFIELALNNKMV